MGEKPIFYTESQSRWKSFRWSIRIVLIFLVIGVVAVTISLLRKQALQLPPLKEQTGVFRKVTDNVIAKNDQKEYKRLERIISEARKTRKHEFYAERKAVPGIIKNYYPVKAGFFVNWDPQSEFSLKHNINKLNMILPEWLFITDSSDEIYDDVDSTAMNFMRKNHVAIVPILSNFYNKKWNGVNVHKILASPTRRAAVINNIYRILTKYHFAGINIDFEDLVEKTDDHLITFQRELYEKLHRGGFLVSQDISPFNEDYNTKELGKYNDLLFLMAYDQHSPSKAPGPIAAQYWVEAAMDDIFKKVSPQKVVLCIAGYGYNWTEGHDARNSTYQEAMADALGNNAPVHFDNQTYNLNFSYYDSERKLHRVYFTDAVSNYNAIRTAYDNGMAGYALWRLGSEDARLWGFFAKDLSMSGLKKQPFDYHSLEHIKSSFSVDYIGSGEVLNIVSSPRPGRIKLEVNKGEQAISEESYLELPSSYVINRTGKKDKMIAFTFDDGPDEDYTPQILEILSQHHVPAAFFVTGINAEQNLPILQRMYREGHTIGNHTFLHPNVAIISSSRFRAELRSTGYIIEGITGHATMLYRPPYDTDLEPTNPSAVEPMSVARSEGYLTIGSNIDPLDWEVGVTSDSIIARVIRQTELSEINGDPHNIILLHDAGGNRAATIAALPHLIEYFKAKGYKFVSIADLLDRKRDDLMPQQAGDFNRYLQTADATVVTASYIVNRILSIIFFVALLLSVAKILTVAVLAIVHRRRMQKQLPPEEISHLKMSVIVPAYNEEITACKTVENLLKSTYPNLEIIFVDDGSKDNTYQNVLDKFGNHPKVSVNTKPNGGKASALNYGIQIATGDILVCIDADTLLKADAISKLAPYFTDPKVAAVAGNVKVGNRVNLLTHWQSIEYITSQNFDRRAFDILNAIMVIPGAIGAFRRNSIIEVGGFDTDTLAEDCDLTMRLLRKGYVIHCCNEALAFTEAPETMNMLLRQRLRWSFGIMQSFWKHRKMMFKKGQTNMNWILLPHQMIFQLFLPLMSPVVDIIFLVSIFMPKATLLIVFYFAYFILDLCISFMAFKFDGEKFRFKYIFYLFIQRILYRQLLWYVLMKSYLRAIKGELAAWGILKRTGNTNEPKE
jgi:cellulose synthase/poly-beta-1,6-N-acetylglucosamine synthase-like glycosyltransferase/spore germination protein YaaH/peptidoglycan/xylan/chitin deacetylase (PgdA/CDA1 family)